MSLKRYVGCRTEQPEAKRDSHARHDFIPINIRKPETMDIGTNDHSTKHAGRPRSLGNVLEHSERVKALVAECADDLASLNGAMSRALTARHAPPGLAEALGQSAVLLAKVQAVAVALAVVNRALDDEIRYWSLVDLQFAAAEEQGQASRHAALHDVLTGLPNRALFKDRLDHGLAQAWRQGWGLAVLFVDLNGFKDINDTHGHDVGDAVLQTIAQRLKDNTRDEDTVSRYGGDEFLYLLTGICDAALIAKIAEKIVQSVQAPNDIRLHDKTFSARVTASIGIATFPKDGTTAEALIERADEAMYRAKQAGSGLAFAQSSRAISQPYAG
jgi:diguanylate cyclase